MVEEIPVIELVEAMPGFPDRTRSVVTDCLGLTTLLMAGLSVVSVTDRALSDATGSGAPVLIVLGSLLVGGITGSLLRIGDRLEALAGGIEAWFARRSPALADTLRAYAAGLDPTPIVGETVGLDEVPARLAGHGGAGPGPKTLVDPRR